MQWRINCNISGGVEPYNFLWSPEPGSGQGTSTASGLCADDYSLLVTDAGGCTFNYEFTINDLDEIVSNLQIGNVSCSSICDGWATVDPVGVSGNYSYLWAPEPNFGQGTDSVAGLCTGEYIVLITDVVNGCNITDTFNVFMPDSIWVTDTLMVNPECLDDDSGEISISVTGGAAPYQYQWYLNSNIITGATDTIVTGIPGEYLVEITDLNGCTITQTYQLTATSTLIVDAGSDTSYCAGTGPALLIGSGNGITHMWINTQGDVLSTTDSLIIDPESGINNYIFIVSDGICTISDTAQIEIYDLPLVDAGPDIEILTDESATIGGNPTAPDFSTMSWSPLIGLNDSTVANPTASPIETTEYIVYATEPINGCSTSDTMLLTVVPDFNPNDGFTPNGDGINDVWIIANIDDFPNIEVLIFNRWGEEVFFSEGYDIPWDGLFDGKELPVGTYFYIIDLHDEKFPDAFSGPLTIMR